MGRLTNSKKIKLLKLEKARLQLSADLKNGLITEEDLIKLGTKDVNYGFKYGNINYKLSVLKSILNLLKIYQSNRLFQ